MDFRECYATPVKSIRAKCLECCGYQNREVELCTALACPLFPYRMGKKPKKGVLIGLQQTIELTKRKNRG